MARLWERAHPDLPPEVEAHSFVSSELLRPVARALCLARELDVGLPASADAVMCVNAFQFAAALAVLQDEARERLPTAGLVRRVVVTATAPGRSAA